MLTMFKRGMRYVKPTEAAHLEVAFKNVVDASKIAEGMVTTLDRRGHISSTDATLLAASIQIAADNLKKAMELQPTSQPKP